MKREDGARTVELEVRSRTVWKVGLNVLALLAAVHVLTHVSAVVSWILIALILALALDPVVSWLERRKLPRWLAVLGVFLVVLGLFAALGITFVPLLVDQGRALVEHAPATLDRLRESSAFAWADERFDVVAKAKEQVGGNAERAFGSVMAILGSLVLGIAGAVTIFVLTAFMLLFGPPLARRAIDWLPPERRPRVIELGKRMHRSVGGYVLGSLVVALIGGVVTGVALAILGVPYFLPLALLMALLGVIPFVGPTIGGVMIVGTTFLTSGTKAGIIAAIIFVVYQQLENEILQPLVQKKTIRMNPLLIALAVLVGTYYAGVLGALLALPLAGAVQVLLRDVLERRQERWGEGSAGDPDAAGSPDDHGEEGRREPPRAAEVVP
jgi:putative heme transporter